MKIYTILKKGIKYIVDSDYRFLINSFTGLFYKNMDDAVFLKKKYHIITGKELDLNNPKTINEKMQWLKLNDHNDLYTILVDKYKVRNYVKEKIGEKYLIPLIGVWDNPDDIDFDALPNQFVLKCNHNSGLGMCICKNKSKLNIKKIKSNLKKGLKQDYYLTGREWPYKNVDRKIICEKYMIDESNKELKDYKFYCFNGEMKFVMINSGRFTCKNTKADYFDRNFEWLDFTWGYEHSNIRPEKPKMFEEMCRIAEKLSEGLKYVRVDLYNINGDIYFGEFTFFDGSGFDKICPINWDYKFGDMINIK